MPLESEIVFFAIRGAVRLGVNLRQALVERVQDRALVLPLPKFNTDFDPFRAFDYFKNHAKGREHASSHARVTELLTRAAADVRNLSEPERGELTTLYRDCYFLDHAADARELTASARTELVALVTVRQWHNGQNPNPTWVQRLAGSLIEIGTDYLRTFPPDALRAGSKYERVTIGLLDALGSASLGSASSEEWDALPGRLLTAALDAVANAPEVITGEPALQELTQLAAQSLLTSAKARLERASDTRERETITRRAEIVLHGLLTTAGARVLADPGKFLGVTDDTAQAAISKVGGAVLGLMLDTPDRVRLDPLRTRAGVSRLVDATLELVAEHPEAFGADDAALRTLVVQMATDLDGVVQRVPGAALPEVMRVVLRRTGENLPLLWPAPTKKPEAHLGIAVAQAVLEAATRPPARGAAWRPEFSQAQLLDVLDHSLHELVANPGWLVNKAGTLDPTFGVAVAAIFDALRRRGDARLSPALVSSLARAAIDAVVRQPDFARKVAGKNILAAELTELVLAHVLDPDLPPAAAARLVRDEVIDRLMREIFERLGQTLLTDARVAQITAFFAHWIPLWSAGAPVDFSAIVTDLEHRLAA